MCSRYTVSANEQEAKRQGVQIHVEVYGAVRGVSIHPADRAPILIPDVEKGCRMVVMRWGWTLLHTKSPLIIARSESIRELPTFRPYLNQRCCIIANGFLAGDVF